MSDKSFEINNLSDSIPYLELYQFPLVSVLNLMQPDNTR